MHRREPNRAAPPLFAAAGGWHAWRYWPGLFGLLSVFLLWFVVIAEVMVPLGHTLAQVRSGGIAEASAADRLRTPARRARSTAPH